jgi:signal peptidase II
MTQAFFKYISGHDFYDVYVISFTSPLQSKRLVKEEFVGRILTKYRWHFLIAISIVGLALDQLTKFWAATHLQHQPPMDIIGNYLQVVLVYNKNAIFGLDPRKIVSFFPLNTFFYIFNAIAITFIIFYYKSLRESDTLMKIGLSLIMPGALGNLYDRIVHPGIGVVDFIKMGISETVYWPIYNLADMYVTFGVAIIFLYFILEEVRRKKNVPTQPPTAPVL